MDLGLLSFILPLLGSPWAMQHLKAVAVLLFLLLDVVILASYLFSGQLLGGSTSFYGQRVKLHIVGSIVHLLSGTLAVVALLCVSSSTSESCHARSKVDSLNFQNSLLQSFITNSTPPTAPVRALESCERTIARLWISRGSEFRQWLVHTPEKTARTLATNPATTLEPSRRCLSLDSVARSAAEACAIVQALTAILVCGPTTLALAPYCLGHRGAALVGYTCAGILWMLAGASQLLSTPNSGQALQLLVYAHTFALVRAIFWLCFKLSLPTESNMMAYTMAIFVAFSITMTSAWGRNGFLLWLCIAAVSWLAEALEVGKRYHVMGSCTSRSMSKRLGLTSGYIASQKGVTTRAGDCERRSGDAQNMLCCPILGFK